MLSVLSMLSLASGIERENVVDLKVAPSDFGALNDGAAELFEADCRFSLAPPRDLAALVSLAKQLKKQEGVEVLIIDALHRIELERGRDSTPSEQRSISQVLTAVAHAGELTVVAGFNRPHVPFPDLVADSVSYCKPLARESPLGQQTNSFADWEAPGSRNAAINSKGKRKSSFWKP
jgi:DnaB-like helicase C terminal domain